MRGVNRDTVPTRVQRAFRTEFRVEKRADGLATLKGHAAVFNQLSDDLGWYRERINPGAFDGLLGDERCFALWNHNPDFIIAAVADQSLRLSQDEVGLFSEIDPMDTQTIRDLVVKPIEDGKVRKMSFAFDVDTAHWEMENGVDVRVVDKVARLWDVSPVTYPAYPQTDISARSLAMLAGNLNPEQRGELVKLLQHADFKRLIATGEPAPAPGTQEGPEDVDAERSSDEEYLLRLRHHERIARVSLAA